MNNLNKIKTFHSENALFDDTRLLDYKNKLNKEKRESIY